jgi:type I restriction enzyme S subunit
VPAHWDVKRLRHLSRINPPRSEIQALPGDTLVSFVPMEAIGEDGSLQAIEFRALSEIGGGYTYFRNNDVLVAKITPCFENGKGALCRNLKNGIGLGTTELHVLRSGPEIDPLFLFYLTRSSGFHEQGEAAMYGAAGQQRVPADFIENFAAPLPPLAEQRAIAAFLDAETARIDTLMAKQEALIATLQEKRRAVISHAVTKGLDPAAPMKDSGVPWLGAVPAHWEVKPIKYLVKMESGGTPDKSKADYWDGAIPWASAKDLKVDLLYDTEDHITQYALDSGAASLVAEESVIIVVRGMILLHTLPVSVNLVPVAINQDLKALHPNSNVSSRFLAWSMRGLSDAFLARTDTAGHGTKALRTEDWNDIELGVPPLQEQHCITAYLDQETTTIDTLIAKAQAFIALLREHRTALIAAAVTGQIDVRGV